MVGRSAPRHFIEFKEQIKVFGEGLQSVYDVLKNHEMHLFTVGVKGTVDNNVQRSLSEVVGDFKNLQNHTEEFLKEYKFMELKKGSRDWAWKKVKVYGEATTMCREMEAIRKQYMFQTAKVQMVLEPLKMYVVSPVSPRLFIYVSNSLLN